MGHACAPANVFSFCLRCFYVVRKAVVPAAMISRGVQVGDVVEVDPRLLGGTGD